MKNKYLIIGMSAFGILILLVFFIGKAMIPSSISDSRHDNNTQSNIAKQTTGDSIPSNWKTYTSDRIGITFRYPDSWSKVGDDANVSNLSGDIVEVDIAFTDIATQSNFLVKYFKAPNGAQVYQNAIQQYNSSKGWYVTGGKQIEVAGYNAIEAYTTINIDGKGHPLNPPLRFIIVDFLDKQQKGTIELQYSTPLNSTEVSQVKILNQLLSSIRFIN